ncbi:MarR family winged helix-turn-helix transcriptional regulator [Hugenholtzia roseola]|uniref:MarR family winged helix-turn-helix transcriptional regulator n=1 Tax=Hugenholtzia roseola TaxID=1002 RepID=UPI0004182A5D|nr:MarR family transcriptional regulator [Hugenholtzia roseola]
MDSDALLKLENQICFPLYAASRLITRLYQPYLEAWGLTYPQYLVLLFLWEKEKGYVQQIAQSLFLETNTVTPLLKRMEQAQWIERRRCVEDERKVEVLLTQKGRDLKAEAHCLPQRLVSHLNLSLEELHHLKVQLQKITETLEKVEDKK